MKFKLDCQSPLKHPLMAHLSKTGLTGQN
jgi:hypothetical protein